MAKLKKLHAEEKLKMQKAYAHEIHLMTKGHAEDIMLYEKRVKSLMKQIKLYEKQAGHDTEKYADLLEAFLKLKKKQAENDAS